GDVRVSLKTVLFDQRKDPFHLALVVDVLREDIFVERIARRAVHEQEAILAMRAWPLREKFPAALAVLASVHRRLQLRPRPETGTLRRRVKAFRIEHRSLVVIAQQAHPAFHDQVPALARIRPITDYG